MTTDEQRIMVERSLGECMLNHGFTVLHLWLREVPNEQHEERLRRLEASYREVFEQYLDGAEDPAQDPYLEHLTHDTYCLVDDVYRAMRLKSGQSPKIVAYNRDNAQSVTNYFYRCVELKEEDLDWLYDEANSDHCSAAAILGISALMNNLREVFMENVLFFLIDLIDADDSAAADNALMAAMMILIQYDVRIDFFVDVQKMFLEKIGDGERAFELLCAMLRRIRVSFKDQLESGEVTMDSIPEELREAMGDAMDEDKLLSFATMQANEESQYVTELAAILPGTWLYSVLVGDDEARARKITRLYVEVGRMELMWDSLDEAEQIIVEQLRKGKALPQDYINYGHICFLKGDKMMAYENYREAKRMLGSTRMFMALFRPDRRFLVDHGLNLEQVYLMEDALVR